MPEPEPEFVRFVLEVFWGTLPGPDSAKLLLLYPDGRALTHFKKLRRGKNGELSVVRGRRLSVW